MQHRVGEFYFNHRFYLSATRLQLGEFHHELINCSVYENEGACLLCVPSLLVLHLFTVAPAPMVYLCEPCLLIPHVWTHYLVTSYSLCPCHINHLIINVTFSSYIAFLTAGLLLGAQ